MNILDEIKLLITANAEGAIAVISGFTGTATSELATVEANAAAAGTRGGTAFASKFGAGATTGIATLAGTFAALGEAFFAKSAVSTAIDYNRATAAVNATLKATGDISGATAGGIDRLSNSLEKSQAIFAGTIKQGAALLLTFTDVQNQPGPGEDIFNRALTTATALSNVRGIPLDTAITQIGRVLENPQSGSQALQRSGITLAEQDKQRIIDLAKQGDLLGAQKALLDAIANKGIIQQGAAIAAADPSQQFSVAYKELKKTIGEDLLPAATELFKIVSGTFGVLEHFPAPLRNVVELLAVAGAAVLPLKKVGDVFSSIKAIGNNRNADAGITAGADAVDVAGTKAGAAISSGADDLLAAGEKAAEALKAATFTGTTQIVADGTGGETGTVATATVDQSAVNLGEAGTLFATKVDESANLLGESGALIAKDVEAGGVALNDAASVLFEKITAGASTLTDAADAMAAKLLAVADRQAAGQATVTGRGPVAVSEPSQIIAVDSAGNAAVEGMTQSVAQLDATTRSLDVTVSGTTEQLSLFDNALVLTREEADAAYAALNELAAAELTVGNSLTLANGTAVEFATTEELLAARARLLAAADDTAALSLRGFVGSLGGLGIFALGAITVNQLLDSIGNKAPKVDALSRSIDSFFKTGQTSGGLQQALDNLDPRIAKIVADQKQIEKVPGISLPGVKQLFDVGFKIGEGGTGQLSAVNTYKATIAELDQKMSDLVTNGNISEANSLFQKLASQAGLTFAQFPQFKAALDDFVASQSHAAHGASDLTSEFGKLSQQLDGVKSELTVAQDFLQLHDAQKQLIADQADKAGTGDKAKAALQGVAQAQDALTQTARTSADDQQRLADAYVSVQDAQDRVTSSTHSLAEARAALALFDSPRGAQERALAADILNRRVATTPAEEDQKQLDILQNQDSNAQKQQQLQDAVVSAEKSQRDAFRAVSDAQRSVIDANQKIHDDAKTQQTDQAKLADAIKNVQKVHATAAEAIQADQIKVQLAVVQTGQDINNDQLQITQFGATWLKQLSAIADSVAPGSDLAKNIHKILNEYAAGLIAAEKAAPKTAQITIGGQTYSTSLTTPPPASIGPTTASVGPQPPPSVYGVNPATGQLGWYNPLTGLPVAHSAYGNILRFASGGTTRGIENHIAQIDHGSATMRVWAEPETGGEAYIPLAEGKRSRSTDILATVAGQFGYRLEHYADGGMTHYATGAFLPSASPSTRSTDGGFHQTINQENNFHGKETPAIADLDFANRELGWRLSRSGRR